MFRILSDFLQYASPSHVFGRALSALIGATLSLVAHANTESVDLQVDVFMSSEDHMGFGVASTLIYGPTEVILVDSQFTRSNALRVLAKLYELDRNLTHIYITHEHPDHWLGTAIIKDSFPDARVVSLPVIADGINGSLDFNLEYWGRGALGNNGATRTEFVHPLDQNKITVDGEVIELLGPFNADAEHSSAVWIPSHNTLIAGDIVFNQAHPWLADADLSPYLVPLSR